MLYVTVRPGMLAISRTHGLLFILVHDAVGDDLEDGFAGRRHALTHGEKLVGQRRRAGDQAVT